MKNTNEPPSFLNIGLKILAWYHLNKRDLPWRHTKDPYQIWISEVVLQQTRVEQGRNHFERFVERFPDIQSLQLAKTDEVLLYWKGLGYYSRALNLHKAAKQLAENYGGTFPQNFKEIKSLAGIGPYTAAAIASIAFDEKIPAVDGNFYRVLSRIFADDFDISSPKAHAYFTELALQLMPDENPGDFNQAIMDLGSEVCKPKQPLCPNCPVNDNCLAFSTGTVALYPVKTKKAKVSDLYIRYYFVYSGKHFLIQQRDESFIWKKLYEFPHEVPPRFINEGLKVTQVHHKLTHKNLTIDFVEVPLSLSDFENLSREKALRVVTVEESHQLSFPKPLQAFIEKFAQKRGQE